MGDRGYSASREVDGSRGATAVLTEFGAPRTVQFSKSLPVFSLTIVSWQDGSLEVESCRPGFNKPDDETAEGVQTVLWTMNVKGRLHGCDKPQRNRCNTLRANRHRQSWKQPFQPASRFQQGPRAPQHAASTPNLTIAVFLIDEP